MSRAHREPRLIVGMPRSLLDRLRFATTLDGRPVTEWVRAVLSEAVGRLLVSRPGWAWARPASPWWETTADGVLGAPSGGLEGGERVLALDVLPEAFGRDLDPEGDGTGILADVVPGDPFDGGGGGGGRILRRVVLRAVDVLPWRRRRGEPIPARSPGAVAAEERARRSRETAARWERERRGKASEPLL